MDAKRTETEITELHARILAKSGVPLVDSAGEALLKGMGGHKYIRRIPKPGGGYRYFYSVTGGGGIANRAEQKVGARFQGGEGMLAIEITKVEGDQVTFRHPGIGAGDDVHMTLSPVGFQNYVVMRNREAVDKRIAKFRSDYWKTRYFGTEKQVARMDQERARLLKELTDAKDYLPEPDRDVRLPGYKEHEHWFGRIAVIQETIIQGRPLQRRGMTPDGKTPQPMGRALRKELEDLLEALPKLKKSPSPKSVFGSGFQRDVLEMGLERRVRDILKGTDVLGNLRGDLDAVKDYLNFTLIRGDLHADSKEQQTPDATVWADQLAAAVRERYFAKGRGTRGAYDALMTLIPMVRTQRGIAAFTKLVTESAYGNSTIIPQKPMRTLLGDSLFNFKKEAEDLKQYLTAHGWENLKVDNTPVGQLTEAIKQDRQTAIQEQNAWSEKQAAAARPTGDTPFEQYGTSIEHKVPELAEHRFNQLPEEKSATARYFMSRFGVRVKLHDETFDAFMLEDRFRARKDVISMSEDPQEKDRAQRFLRLEKHQFGLFAMEEAPYRKASKGEIQAANEIKAVTQMSTEAKEQALQSIARGLTLMEEAIGQKIDLSGLPIVVNNRAVSGGANAHYRSARSKQQMVGLERQAISASHTGDTRHIALGMGYFKSLAHEVVHYLDNRTTLRAARKHPKPFAKKQDTALLEVVAEELGVDPATLPEDSPLGFYARADAMNRDHAKAGDLLDVVHDLNRMIIHSHGTEYTSNLASLMLRAHEMPEFKSDFGQKLIFKMNDFFRENLEGYAEIRDLFQASAETGVVKRNMKKDEEGDPMTRVLQELSGGGAQDPEAARYWSNGTEMLARLVEQYVHHKLADQGKLNPSLTHATYRGDRATSYVHPKEMRELMPKVERVLKFLGENMTKSEGGAWIEIMAGQAFDLIKAKGHKYLRRVPKPGGGYRYYYNVTSGKGLGHPDEFKVGSSFQVGDGHYHVVATTSAGRVRVEHDESGEQKTFTTQDLTGILHDLHAEKLNAKPKGKLKGAAKRSAAAAARRREQVKRLDVPDVSEAVEYDPEDIPDVTEHVKPDLDAVPDLTADAAEILPDTLEPLEGEPGMVVRRPQGVQPVRGPAAVPEGMVRVGAEDKAAAPATRAARSVLGRERLERLQRQGWRLRPVGDLTEKQLDAMVGAIGNQKAQALMRAGLALDRATPPLPSRTRKSEKIPGGKGDDLKPGDVDPEQLRMGIAHEMEHTTDRAVAKEIALDHLAEDPRYYTKIKRIEKADLALDLDTLEKALDTSDLNLALYRMGY